jgi:hypothetical protein
MTKKRWIVLAGLLATCVCLTLAVLALLPPRRSRVTPANYERIETGLSRKELQKIQEVEEILGAPAECHADDGLYCVWNNRGYRIIVHHDNRGRVRKIISEQWEPQPETFLEMLSRLFHL